MIALVMEEDWPKAMYEKVKRMEGNLWLESSECSKIMLMDAETDEAHPLIRRITQAQPGIEKAIKLGDLAPGKVICNLTTSSVDTEDAVIEETTEYYTFQKVRDICNVRELGDLAIATTDEEVQLAASKLAECIFTEDTRKVILHFKKNGKPQRESENGRVGVGMPWKECGRPKIQTVLVKVKEEAGTSYAEIVSNMRTQINVDDIGVRVKSVRETKQGHIQIKIAGGREGNR